MQLHELLAQAQRLEIKSRHLARSHYAGLYRSAFKGQGVECAEVREYAEGDDIRLIDWNVSARSQSLYVKKMVEERDRNVMVVVDTSGSLRFGTVRRTKFDLLLELAAIFILTGFYARDRISLACFALGIDLFIPPAKGWNHAARLIREMVAQQPAGRASNMEPLWSFLNSPGMPRSLILLMTDFEAPLIASNSFSAAGRKHEIVFILVSDPREWSLPNVGRIRVMHPETGATRIVDTSSESLRSEYSRVASDRRTLLLHALQLAGIDWVEFSTAADYDAPLRRYLQSRIIRRGYRRL